MAHLHHLQVDFIGQQVHFTVKQKYPACSGWNGKATDKYQDICFAVSSAQMIPSQGYIYQPINGFYQPATRS